MNEVIICALGPSATVEASCLSRGGHPQLPPAATSCHPTVFGTGDQPIGESSSEELGNLRDGQVDVESENSPCSSRGH